MIKIGKTKSRKARTAASTPTASPSSAATGPTCPHCGAPLLTIRTPDRGHPFAPHRRLLLCPNAKAHAKKTPTKPI